MTRTGKPYDEAFFDAQSQRSLESARVVLGYLFPMLHPRRIADIGCGVGSWLRAAIELGTEDVVGIDGDYVDRAALLIDPDRFLQADLAVTPLQQALGRHAATRFDLVICMEVAEHLPHARAASLVAELASLADIVLFSAAVPFQHGTHHVNEQWPEYWSILFRDQGFATFDPFRSTLWADPRVEWWYAQNCLVFAREGSQAAERIPAGSRADGKGLALVHPENLLSNLLGLPRRYRREASAEEFADLRNLAAANLRQEAKLPTLAAVERAMVAGPDARDVFPWTRTATYQPEEEIAKLQQHLLAAEQACRDLRDAHDAERAARSAERAAREAERMAHGTERAAYETQRAAYETERAAYEDERVARLKNEAALRERVQAHSAARHHAEVRMREACDVAAKETEQLLATRRDIAALQEALRRADAENAARAHVQVVQTVAAAPQVADGPLPRLRGRIKAVGRLLPVPVRQRIRRLQGIRPGASAPVMPPPEPAPPSPEPIIDAEPVHEKAPIRQFGATLGDVHAITLEAAVDRLRHFPLFDGEDYLRRYPDVAQAGIEPHAHFLQSGALEGRGGIGQEDLARVLSGFRLFEHAKRSLDEPAEEAGELQRLVAATGRIGIYASSQGNVFMEEIAGDLAADLRCVGLDVDLLDEWSDMNARPPISLFVAPHEFFILGRGRDWVRDDVISHSFMLGTEQVQTNWFNLALPFVLMSRGVLDICAQTADLFLRTGAGALHVLPGAKPRMWSLSEREKAHPLFRALPSAARDVPLPDRPFADRPIDIAFFGTSSPRRDAFMARNAGFLADYETFAYRRHATSGPILGDGEDGMLTQIAGHVSGHAKITLNIHRDELGYFEWHRMVRLGMCAGSVVVSDPCLPNPNFVPGEHYFEEIPRHIPDLIEWLLRTPDGRREAARVQRNCRNLLTSDLAPHHTALKLLRFFASHRVEIDALAREARAP
ncbi:methyltransferase domain-containing protein [Falsiroseomonas sp. E2-1-a20]|uniref:methyltransferase domain-containing protein n=1 Tax=Falsiroseomonas sp. E2-1-a20 TaxID=3239300 RepID=UPI003F36377C